MSSCRLVREVNLLLRGLLCWRPSNYGDASTLARHNLSIATALHCLLDALRWNTLLHKLVTYAIQLIWVTAKTIYFNQLLTSPMPICLRFDLISELRTVNARWSMVLRWRNATLVMHMEILHLQTVVIAYLLIQSCWRRALHFFNIVWRDCVIADLSRSFALLRIARLVGTVNYDRLASSARIVLRWRHVHLVLVLASWLYNARRLSYYLLVRELRLGATWQLRTISQSQVEFTSVELHHIVAGYAWTQWLGPLAVCNAFCLFTSFVYVRRLAEVHAIALLRHSGA